MVRDVIWEDPIPNRWWPSDACPSFQIENNGRAIRYTANSNPMVFRTSELGTCFIAGSIRGFMQVDTNADDDFIGVGWGYSDFHDSTYLMQWKGRTQQGVLEGVHVQKYNDMSEITGVSLDYTSTF